MISQTDKFPGLLFWSYVEFSDPVTSPAVSTNLAVNSTWQAAYGSSLRMMFYISAFYNPFLSTHLNWTHWSCKNSSWWVWIIKQHWSKQLYLDQYYPYSIWLYHLLGRTVYAGSLSFLCFDKFLVNVINTSAWCLAFSPSSLIYPKSSYFLANIQKI